MITDLEKLSRLIDKSAELKSLVRWEITDTITTKNNTYPVYTFNVGSNNLNSPVLFITGGVHGLERIGSQLAWSLLKTTIDRLLWDKSLVELFQHIRLVVMPLVNPAGYMNKTRSNDNGVDLMRNSPIQAVDKTPWLLGGQNNTPHLPWYRGKKDKLEKENQILKSVFMAATNESPCIIAVDFHSGFGLKDRIWFPFSYTATPFDDIPEMAALTNLLEQTHPYHIYQIEPQSKGYLFNGDMWDYFYLEIKKKKKSAIFLPLTLEMGSWAWVRKNPAQLFSRHGAFNPIKEHRLKRTFRRHHLLFDFLLKALRSNEVWAKLPTASRQKFESFALERWY